MTLEYIGSIGGIAGILAVLMWLTNRHLMKQMRDDRKYMEDRLTRVIEDYNRVCKANQDALVEHTKVQSEFLTYLKMRNGGK